MVLGRSLGLLRSALLIGGAAFAVAPDLLADGKGGKGAKQDRPATGKVDRPKPAPAQAPAQVPPTKPAPKPAPPVERPRTEPRPQVPAPPKVERPTRQEPARQEPARPEPARQERPRTERPTDSRPRRPDAAPSEPLPTRPTTAPTVTTPPRRERELRETRPTLPPATAQDESSTRPLRERLREVEVDRTRDATSDRVRRDQVRRASESPTLLPTGEAPPSDWPTTRAGSRVPRIEREIAPLPRPLREVAPRQPTSAPSTRVEQVNVDIDIDIDVDGASRCHDDVDVAFWFGDPCNRYPCYVDPCGVQYGYVFCGSSLFWYTWRPGCTPCWRPYRYYWSPSCWWLPSYYPTYASVYVVRDDVTVPPADDFYAAAPAPAPVPAVDAAAALRDGWTAFTDGRYPDALDLFRQAVLAEPDEPFAKLALAQACVAIGNYADAAFLVRRAASLLPDWPILADDPRAHYGDPADHFEQMVALRAFLERVPGEPAATLVLAWQSYFSGDFFAARDAFAELQRLDPADPVAALFGLKLGLPAAPPAATAPDGR